MTDATSSRLGAGFEMTLMSSERRRVPARLDEAMSGREGWERSYGIVKDRVRCRNEKSPG
jgi:hypothetical protein